jgi:hypothetical protein
MSGLSSHRKEVDLALEPAGYVSNKLKALDRFTKRRGRYGLAVARREGWNQFAARSQSSLDGLPPSLQQFGSEQCAADREG